MDAREEMLKLRNEAVQRLRFMFNIKEGESDGTVERIIDCIISAALLEVAIVQRDAMNEMKEGK
jgi:hypothetical protein